MPMDVLSEVLGALRLEGTLYFTTEFRRPWGVRVPPHGNVARFHLVLRGTCWVETGGQPEPVRLESGDLVLVPHGAEHVLSDPPGTPSPAVDEVIQRSGFTGRGALIHGGPDQGHPTRLLCGHFAFDAGSAAHPLLEQLPSRIVIRQEDAARHARVDDMVRLIVQEARGQGPGRDAVVQRLSEVLFIQALRAWSEGAGAGSGLMAALADPQLARGLAAVHTAPGRPWTLEELARQAGLSRTVFAERFRARMGRTPMQYVTFWRVEHACRLLRDGQCTVDDVAGRVGYRSPAAFHRAFRKWVGRSPGEYRRSHA
ncbi:MAG TPA: AraC family transcriptional regulator [bacterium]|nr:AraC family transcriptional regulator [bacterium]